MRTMHPEWRITSLPTPISPLLPPQRRRRLRSDDEIGSDDNVLDDDSSVDGRRRSNTDIVGNRYVNSTHNSSGNDKRRLFGLAKDYHFIRSKGGNYLLFCYHHHHYHSYTILQPF